MNYLSIFINFLYYCNIRDGREGQTPTIFYLKCSCKKWIEKDIILCVLKLASPCFHLNNSSYYEIVCRIIQRVLWDYQLVFYMCHFDNGTLKMYLLRSILVTDSCARQTALRNAIASLWCTQVASVSEHYIREIIMTKVIIYLFIFMYKNITKTNKRNN